MNNILWLLILSAGIFPAKRDAKQYLFNPNGETHSSITVDGRTRTFILYLPGGYTGKESLPLVIALHGGSGSAKSMEKLTGFEAIAEKEKFILVYPDGVEKSWNDGRDTKANELGVDDVKFFRNLIDTIVTSYHANSKRVYVTGISNGGFMTMHLACNLADKITAVAAVAASMGETTSKNCQTNIPMPVLIMHGTKDPLVPFNGGKVRSKAGGAILSHEEAIQKWVKTDHCNPAPHTTHLPDTAFDETTVTKTEYTGGKNNTIVVSYVIENGGHTWPGGWQYLPKILIGRTTRDIDGSKEIWNFFKHFSK